ncbi:serine hydrolase [Xanthovirga aplysinae]|uniref:serine hydrolase n=1 Tax=Xanthovirga aplysinae TaxID=2529853 RepID=UPI0012BD3336|nr:serine hydrolase [Xanthovirga aplysinae]MTI31029.1 serine hydrolase [Xanthovirga aplysinae]
MLKLKTLTFQILSTLLLYFTVHNFVNAQVSHETILQKVDSICNDYGSPHYPGTAVLVVKDGEVLLNKGYGLANLEHEIPITPTTAFDLGSVSKMFTGYAISLLVERGKISLADDIRQYIPELPDYGNIITIDHLLHHTSGLQNTIKLLSLGGWSFDDEISTEQVLRLAYAQKKPNFLPGENYEYSNTGYLLLAELVHKVTGLSFREWTQTNIFEPLEMTQTMFVDDHATVIPNRAYSYFMNGLGGLGVSPNNSQVPGPGSLYSTTTDLAKWLQYVDNPGEKMKPVFDRMFQPGVLNNGKEIKVGFSVFVRDFKGTKWISHEGFWWSFASLLVHFPELHLSVVTLSNHAWMPYDIPREIASLYLPENNVNNKAQSAKPKIEVSEMVLDSYLGTYRLSPGFYLTVTRKENQLFSNITFDGAETFPMSAKSDSVFFIEDFRGKTITFLKDGSGQVNQVIYDEKPCPKVDNEPNPAPNLNDYLGNYFSNEIKTLYTVLVEDRQLKLNHLRIGPQNLNHVRGDDFLVERWEPRFPKGMEFLRDENGKVFAFSILNHRFVKVIEE